MKIRLTKNSLTISCDNDLKGKDLDALQARIVVSMNDLIKRKGVLNSTYEDQCLNFILVDILKASLVRNMRLYKIELDVSEYGRDNLGSIFKDLSRVVSNT